MQLGRYHCRSSGAFNYDKLHSPENDDEYVSLLYMTTYRFINLMGVTFILTLRVHTG